MLGIVRDFRSIDRTEGSTRAGNLRCAGRVRSTLDAFQNLRSSEDLDSVADGRNRLFHLEEVADVFQNLRVEAEVFRCTAAGDEETAVAGEFDDFKVCVDGEVVAWLLSVGLVT